MRFRPTHASSLLLALLALPLPAPATAGPPGPEDVPADLLVADWKLGPFYVKPAFAVRDVGVDSNVFLDPRDPRDDFTATFAPALRLALPLGDNLLSLTEEVTYVYYDEFASERSWNFATALRLEAVVGALRVDLQETFRRTRERFGFEVLSRPRRNENRFDLTLGSDRDAGVYLEGAFSHNYIRFSSDAEFDGLPLGELLDRTEIRGGLAAFVEMGPGRLIAGGDLLKNDFRSPGTGRDSDGWFAYSGVRIDPGRLVAGDVRVGYQKVDVARDDHPDFSGLGLLSTLTVGLTDSTSLVLTASRQPVYSTFGDNIYATTTQLAARLRLPLADRFAIDVGPTWARSRYPVPEPLDGLVPEHRVDRVVWLEVGGVVRATEALSIHLGFVTRRLRSSFPDLDYDSNSFTSGLGYGR